jgi:ribosomal protein S14
LQPKITKLNSLKHPEFSPKTHEKCDATGRIRFIT